MSVLIKGMEMPTSCDDCEFCKRDISGYDWCCIPMVNGRSKPLDEPVIKPDWCPLVPVPPHGRLIDADAMDTSILQAGFSYALTRRKLRYTPGEVRDKIAYAPTIIPAEEET